MDNLISEKEAPKRLRDARYTIHVLILAAITLVVGIYFVQTAVLISKDGTLYVEIARKMAGNMMETIRGTGQAPGYPFLICLVHKITGVFHNADSLQGWIISAQMVSLLSKLAASLALYFIGSYLVGARFSFWGVLILTILPDSIDFGSDVLTDWPSLMFLSIGFLLLLFGAEYCKHWMWGLAGIAAGIGYLIRPECGQLVLYGGIWLAYQIVRPQGEMKRAMAVTALVLLAAGFAVIAFPYIRCKGYVIPEQRLLKLPTVSSASDTDRNSVMGSNLCLAGLPVGKAKGCAMLINNVCETLVYFYVPALAIGGYYYFRKQPRTSKQTFFIAAFILVNVARALWQPTYFGYLSRRHTLPLIAFTVFFVPLGLYIIAGWLSRRTSPRESTEEQGIHRYFFILMTIGVSICAIKLIRMSPLRWEKQGYRDVAKWLQEHTKPNDIIAVPDKRMTFYAERKGHLYSEKISLQAAYIVTKVGRKEGNEVKFARETTEMYSTEINKKKKEGKLVIYRVVD